MAIVERTVLEVLARPQIQERIGQIFQYFKSEITEEIKEIKEDLDPNNSKPALNLRSFGREVIRNLSYKDKLFIQQARKVILNPRNRRKQIIPCEIKHWKSK